MAQQQRQGGIFNPLYEIFNTPLRRIPAAFSDEASQVYGPGLSGGLKAFAHPSVIEDAQLQKEGFNRVGADFERIRQLPPEQAGAELFNLWRQQQMQGAQPGGVIEGLINQERAQALTRLDLTQPSQMSYLAATTAAADPRLAAPNIQAMSNVAPRQAQARNYDARAKYNLAQQETEDMLRPAKLASENALGYQRNQSGALSGARMGDLNQRLSWDREDRPTEVQLLNEQVRGASANANVGEARASELSTRLSWDQQDRPLERADKLAELVAERKQSRNARQEGVERMRKSKWSRRGMAPGERPTGGQGAGTPSPQSFLTAPPPPAQYPTQAPTQMPTQMPTEPMAEDPTMTMSPSPYPTGTPTPGLPTQRVDVQPRPQQAQSLPQPSQRILDQIRANGAVSATQLIADFIAQDYDPATARELARQYWMAEQGQ